MKVAIIYNEDLQGVINTFGMQNKEIYNPNTVKLVGKCLEDGGHNVEIIDGNMHVVEKLQTFMPKVLEGEQMGMVFNMAYGIQGESRYTHIPSLLEMLGLPYVGSSPAGHALALDKVITKIIMQKHGISTPEYWVFSSPEDEMSTVKYPVIVKPKMESVSFGLKVVYNESDLKEAVNFIITEFQQQALVEQFIPGREFCVGLLGNNPVEAFPVLEIDLENDPDAIQTVDDKKHAPRKKICPAEISAELNERMVKESIAAFKALQLRDFSRVDIRMCEDGKIYLLEINSMASLGKTGSYVAAAKVAGYDYSALVNKMLDVASVRYFASERATTEETSKKRVAPSVRMRGFLRGRLSNYEKLLNSMVSLNTYVRNTDGVNTLGMLVRKEFAHLGFTQEIFPQVEVGNQLFFTNSHDEKYDYLFIGSLDNITKFADHKTYRDRGQKLTGTGIWENKGGLAVMVASLQALKFIRHLKKTKIGILLTSDDSLQGKFSRSLVDAKSKDAKYVLGFHGAGPEGTLITSRSGAARYNFHLNLNEGKADHVAKASVAFAKLCAAFSDLSIDDESVVIAPAEIKFKSNIMHPFASGEIQLSTRFNNLEDFEGLDEKIRMILPKKFIKNPVKWNCDGGLRRQPMVKSKKVEEFWEQAKSIASKLDIRIREEHRWSSSDICFIDTSNKLVLDGFGMVGNNPYNSEEYVLKHSLIERALFVAMLILEMK